MQTQSNQAAATHRIELGGEVAFANPDTFQQVCDALVEKHGGQPKVTRLSSTDGQLFGGDCRHVATIAAPVLSKFDEPLAVLPGEIDATGRDRSNAARFEMRANGFAPKPPVYAVGSRVNEWGVRNAETSRREYDALPLVKQSCDQLIQVVAGEKRQDVPCDRLNEVRMRDDGRLVRAPGADGVTLTEQAFGGFLSRTGIGGHSYLTKCPAELRATNVNHWMGELKFNERNREIEALARKEAFEPKDAKFRTRLNRGEREIFAVVSGSYGAFDADKIATALGMAAPPDARGSIVYDGTRMKAETLFHTNVAPEQFVAGEFFKAGVLVRSDDTGGGSIRVSAVVWQNLCLNLIILDECVQPIAAIRHVGSVQALARKFRDAFKQALGSIEGFLAKWNYAVQEDVRVDGDFALSQLPVSVALRGLFNGIIERELVPVRGQRKDVVQGLMRMYEKDDSSARIVATVSRAAVVNAFTRYAHEVNVDPFQQDEIERAAGGLLNLTRANKVLPYEPIDF